MDNNTILIGLAGVIASSPPLLFASIGETFTERAGVINLSVNGTILLTAMAGVAVTLNTGSLVLGFLAGAVIGALVALVVAFSSIALKISQVAVGFVLALLCKDLATFLGVPIVNQELNLFVNPLPIPGLKDIPILGPLLFNQNILVYASFLLIIVAYIYIYKTRAGLLLRAVGERPAAAYVRGANVNRQRYLYTALGGAMVGLAGPMFSLSVKIGWAGNISGLDGFGWIALAITIFGAWNPVRVAFGVFLINVLSWLAVVLQASLVSIPSQFLQAAPFPLMILTLLMVNISNAEWVEGILARLPDSARRIVARIFRSLRSSPPGSLGIPFENE
jgi:ABC-type uncharacterized transport system permease subunit